MDSPLASINIVWIFFPTVQGRCTRCEHFVTTRPKEFHPTKIFWLDGSNQWLPESQWNDCSDELHLKMFERYRTFLSKSQKWVEQETAAVWGIQEAEPESIISSTVEEMDSIVKWLEKNMLDCPEMSYQRNGIYLRFNHRDFHKGTSMAEVGRIKKIPKRHRFAIGDSFNDLDMLDLKYVENLACPANACDEVKQNVLRQGGYAAQKLASAGTIEALKAVVFLKKQLSKS